MSYCRFSSDDFRSDLYVYASADDLFVIHVAGSRWAQIPPPEYHYPEEHRVYEGEHGGFHLTPEGVAAWRAWQDENWKFIDIDLPHAGEEFRLSSPGECADKIEELGRLGYYYPERAVARLRAEQKALDDPEDLS